MYKGSLSLWNVLLGTLHFNNGGRYEGEWKNGIELNGEYIFSDGLQYDPEDWSYCSENNDRRFYPEHINGLKPSDRCLMSAQSDSLSGKPLRYIPDGCYDAGDGIYDPSSRVLYQYGKNEKEPLGGFLRNVTDEEHYWIVSHCRKGWDEFIGFQKSTEE
uniref:MORN repeat-containing protein 5-like n=1 Tax=Styela clava TaxID=7725 RepID=UPI00193A716C|nr:MORN repeat-containing protein 5-like [Styela clava]